MKDEIRALTALRGLAAMAVVMQHFSATAQLHAVRTIPSLVPHGYMAVDFFFVLSGFIMCYTYLSRFAAGEPGAYRDFLARRVARVVPLNVVVLLAIVAGGALSTALLGRNILTDSQRLWFDLPVNLLMLQGLGVGLNLNGPSWSISTEFAAYLCFPLLVALSFHRQMWLRALVAAVAVAGIIGLALQHQRLAISGESGVPALVRCFAEFTLGMFAYGIWRSGRAAALGSDIAVALLLGAVVISLGLRIDLPAALLFPFVVLACAHNRGRAAALLGARVPYFLGVVSYALYLIHDMFRAPLLLALKTLHPAPLETLPALAAALVGSLVVIPFAWLCYRGIERPGRDAVRRLFGSVR
jgi:peptidoglycan/LPS O-acetylase OafA/YrhL